MKADRPADYRDIVHSSRLQTRVFVVAAREPCITMRTATVKPRGRDHQAVALDELAQVKPPERWVVAVLLCPGDDARDVVTWLKRHRGDPHRVLFILHPSTDPVAALRPWYDAKHPDPYFIEASTWKELAAQFGTFVNDWIYVQQRGAGWPL